jgi:Bacterial Ig-like domain (group 3)/FG-GAP-like repeat
VSSNTSQLNAARTAGAIRAAHPFRPISTITFSFLLTMLAIFSLAASAQRPASGHIITPRYWPIPHAAAKRTRTTTGKWTGRGATFSSTGKFGNAQTTPQSPRMPQHSQWLPESTARPSSAVAADQPVQMVTHNFGGFLAVPSYQAMPLPNNGTNSVLVTLAADFNKDGSQDIATLDGNAEINVMLNDGKGHFAAPITTASGSSHQFIAAAAADLDEDGYPDIVAKPWVSFVSKTQSLYVFHNKHDGTFAAPTIIPIVASSYENIGSFVIGDVNGDKIPDIISLSSVYDDVNNLSTITVQTFTGVGDSTFNTTNAPQSVVVLGGYSFGLPNESALLQTLNGKLNLVFEAQAYDDFNTGLMVGTSVFTLASNGDGTFNTTPTAEADFAASFGEVSDSSGGLSLVDLNGDGYPDITLNFNDDYVYSALGKPDGTFGDPQVAINTFALNPAGWAVMDVNGDGVPDFVDEDTYYTAVFLGNGDGTFANTTTVYTSNQAATPYANNMPGWNLAAADFDNDGHPDIAIVDSGNADYDRAWVFINRGNGSFAASTSPVPLSDPNTFPQALDPVLALDLNGDGKMDMLVLDQMGSGPYPYLAALGDGKGNFIYKTGIPASPGGLSLTGIARVTGDFNGDGLQDILYLTSSGSGTTLKQELAVALSNGDGTFQSPVVIDPGATTTEVGFGGISIADVNGDGKMDIVAVSSALTNRFTHANLSTSGIYVALGNGDGTFQPMQFVAAGTSLLTATVADLDGDGKADLVYTDAGSITSPAQVSVIYGTGSGSFDPTTAKIVQSGNVIFKVLAGDLNNDGKKDLVLLSEGSLTSGALNQAQAGAFVYLNSSTGYAQPSFETTLYEPGREAADAYLADFNGDGVLDLLYSEYSPVQATAAYYGMQLLPGNGDGTFGAPYDSQIPTASALYLGDYLQDGALDVVIDSSYGVPALLLNQGGTAISLSAGAPSITAGDNAVINASVQPTMDYRPTPGGSMLFSENGSVVGVAEVVAGGATFAGSNFAVGSHTLTASYSGDANFNQSINAGTVNLTVTAASPAPAPNFLLQASVGTLTLTKGQAGSIALTLTANTTFSGNIALSISGPLNGLTTQVSPATVTLAPGQTASVSVTMSSVQKSENHPASEWGRAAGGLSLACVFGMILPLRRKKLSRLLMLVLGLASIAGLAGLSGCGGSGYKTAMQGTSTLVVTATPSVQGVAAQSANLSVTVN